MAKKLLKRLVRYTVQFKCVQLAVSVKVESRPRSDRLHSFRVDLPDGGDDNTRLIRTFLWKSLAGKILCNVCPWGSSRYTFLEHLLDWFERRVLGDQSFLAAA